APQVSWLFGAATTAVTRDEALAAIAGAVPSTGASPLRLRDSSLVLGRLYLLAGDDASAEMFLRARTQACRSLERGGGDGRAWALLGDVLERRGARSEACTAYAKVTDRFRVGASVRRATAGAARLGCRNAKR